MEDDRILYRVHCEFGGVTAHSGGQINLLIQSGKSTMITTLTAEQAAWLASALAEALDPANKGGSNG